MMPSELSLKRAPQPLKKEYTQGIKRSAGASQNEVYMNYIFFWLAAAVLLIAAELGHPSLFFFLSAALGCGAASVGAIYGVSLVAQISLFLAITALAFFPLQWWVRRGQAKNTAHMKTNAYALIGKKGVVVAAIMPGQSGAVRVGGQIWSAKAHESIQENAVIEVTTIAGVHLIVKPAEGDTHGII